MSFKRKLKLNELISFNFSKREIECIDIINSFNIKFTFEQIDFLYKIMNLNLIKNLDKKHICFVDDDQHIYFILDIKKSLYYNPERVNINLSKLKINRLDFIGNLIKKSYKIKYINNYYIVSEDYIDMFFRLK